MNNILKIQKGRSVKERTKEKDVGEEHLSVRHPEKEVNCLQTFQYNHRFLDSSAFEGLDSQEQLR